MQDIEHDMDDLFQRAAENYPLNPGKSDWEGIAKKLNEGVEPAPAFVSVKKTRDKRIIVLFLVLTFLFSSWLIYNNVNLGNTPRFAKNESSNAAGITEEIKERKKTPQSNSTDRNKDAPNPNSSLFSVGTGNLSPVDINTIGRNESNKENEYNEDNNRFQNKRFVDNIFDPATKLFISNSYLNSINTDFYIPDLLVNNIDGGGKLQINDSLLLQTKANTHSVKKNGIYIGVVAGPDFSKVHSGSFGNTGFDAGLLLGFRFSHRLSFETGFIWNRKNYQSKGEDFSMSKVESTMPSGMVINDLQSQSSIIEIPIKIKYDFAVKNYHDFFITGGVSSYIMTNEMNIYHVTLNGSNDKMLGIYKKNNYRLPAVANLSIGYENSISKNLKIRVEPFLKIPLQGMGVGSLPVTSAGLQLGITGRLK
ncbi:MAG: outer membrane beta-barrel protein [Ginsengibacter sp.]